MVASDSEYVSAHKCNTFSGRLNASKCTGVRTAPNPHSRNEFVGIVLGKFPHIGLPDRKYLPTPVRKPVEEIARIFLHRLTGKRRVRFQWAVPRSVFFEQRKKTVCVMGIPCFVILANYV